MRKVILAFSAKGFIIANSIWKGVIVMKRANRNMLEGPLLSGIIAYTIPIILTGILQLLFNAADLVIVGQFCGSVSVGAVGATGAVTSLVVNLFIGLSGGAGVAVAHGLGGRQDDQVSRTVHTALPVAVIAGGLLTILGIFCAEPMLRWMDTPENVLGLSTLYMKIYFSGMIFNMVYNFCAAILRAAGDTRSPLIFLSIAGVINVLFNVMFVTVFHMNVAGVALATVISQGISAVLVVIALMRRKDACRLYLRQLRIYGKQLREIVRIGLPAGLQSSMFGISNVMIQSSINSFGAVFVSGSAAAGNIEAFIYVSMNAFHQTAVNYIGQNTGARQYKRAKRVLWNCLGSVSVLCIVMSGIFLVLRRQLLGIYITDSEQAIQDGALRMLYVCGPYIFCGLMDVSTGALRGLGASLVPMLISVLGVCGIRILWIYTVFQLPGLHTPQVLFQSYGVSWLLTFLAQLMGFMIVCRRQQRQFGENALKPV